LLRLDAATRRPGIALRSVRAAVRSGQAQRAGARVDARHAAQAIHALPALTRAQDIHVLLSATPGRQGAAHRYLTRDTSIGGRFEATPLNDQRSVRAGDCGEQRMDALRRRVSLGWLTEPSSNPRAGATPCRRRQRRVLMRADIPRTGEEPELFGKAGIRPSSAGLPAARRKYPARRARHP